MDSATEEVSAADTMEQASTGRHRGGSRGLGMEQRRQHEFFERGHGSAPKSYEDV